MDERHKYIAARVRERALAGRAPWTVHLAAGHPRCAPCLPDLQLAEAFEDVTPEDATAAVRCGGALQPAGDRAAAPWLMIGVAAFPPLLQLLPKRGGRLPGTRRQIHPHLVLPGAVIERLLLCCAPTAAPTGKCLPMPLRSPPPQVPSVLEGRRDAAPQLYVAPDLAAEPLRSKALAFTSLAGARGVQEKSVDSDVLFTEVAPQVLASLQALLSQLVIPMVAGGGQVTAASKVAVQPQHAESARREFVQVRCRQVARLPAVYLVRCSAAPAFAQL